MEVIGTKARIVLRFSNGHVEQLLIDRDGGWVVRDGVVVFYCTPQNGSRKQWVYAASLANVQGWG